jgi:hypothetical protein
MAPQAGAYGVRNPVSPGRTSGSVNASPYTRTAAGSYGPLKNSQDTTGSSNYAPAAATGAYAGSAATTSPSGGGSAGYGSGPNGYTGRLDRFNSRFDRNRSAFDRQGTGVDLSQGNMDPYGTGTARSAATASGLTSGQYGSTAPASGYGGRTASPYAGGTQSSSSSPYAANPLDRYPTVSPGAGSTTGSDQRFASVPDSLPPAASRQLGYPATAKASDPRATGGYTPPASSYIPGASSYIPGTTGYTPPGVRPYQSPAASSTLPASNPDDPPPYRPGSTADYVPRSLGATAPSSTSGYPTGMPGAGVAPAQYASPVGGLY